MPIYQMLCITGHFPEYTHIRELVKQSATHIMDAGGVVRKIDSWGTRALPQRLRRHGNYHEIADYWTMHFDTSPRTLLSLNGLMRRDPRVIRWTVLKLGSRPEDIAREGRRTLHGDKADSLDP
ncbi:ribosomal protein S6 [Roridomyces roridus]|uniref:Ribosomal protein S6 n=1 Tax=Roridomyces roridus TaxID=1738132 RepID=A0AAD7FWJ4_9AGAR|nr:ribosomal protein S6 [Roridomyces roridus]